jgi:hypothetical protein
MASTCLTPVDAGTGRPPRQRLGPGDPGAIAAYYQLLRERGYASTPTIEKMAAHIGVEPIGIKSYGLPAIGLPKASEMSVSDA